MNNIRLLIILFSLSLYSCKNEKAIDNGSIILKNVNIITGIDSSVLTGLDIRIEKERITAIGKNIDTTGATVMDMHDQYVMPALISAHVHIGALKGTTTLAENYTRENILSQLNQYAKYGILNIMVLGTDRPYLFESGLRDSSVSGLLQGARIYTAGMGFGVPGGAPPADFAMDEVFRPSGPGQISAQMDSLQLFRPDMIKIWVDDFGGSAPKMHPSVYKTIIDEAHKRNIRVAAHVYYAADAQQLAQDGVDVIAHSIRDQEISDTLVQLIRSKRISYIPTLSLDEFSFIYALQPEWINDPFFKESLEPGVYEMITSEDYRRQISNSPAFERNKKGFEIALKNLKKLYDAGVLIAMGTDSGAMPLRAQGFSEHIELELMTVAGLTPQQSIIIATKNAAEVLQIHRDYGTIEEGKIADLIIVKDNPLENIRHTRNITAVFKAGKKI